MDETIDTIAAIATPPGRGGIGIIRLSGPLCAQICTQLIGQLPAPRQGILRPFRSLQNEIIDVGLFFYFPAPHSFTGEDVLEFHGHGSPILLEMGLTMFLQYGARIALPGEFSQRAFLNGKIDLAQAEAVADLINASTQEAVLSATRSLQGVFSQKIEHLSKKMMHCRLFVEAAIDFPEEEVDFLSDETLNRKIEDLNIGLMELIGQAKQGQLLKEGMTIVIVGQPNAGKSSLLNSLTQAETAIVTPIPGTTRDLVKETIQIEGMPLHIIDTAGIRLGADEVEAQGILRAKAQQKLADRILLVVDVTQGITAIEEDILKEYACKVTIVYNKIDLAPKIACDHDKIYISARTGDGIDHLLQHLKNCIGYQSDCSGIFMARGRHVNALKRACQHCQNALIQLKEYKAGECVAEELRLAQNALGEIVGIVTSDDLLGEIFSKFCIGK